MDFRKLQNSEIPHGGAGKSFKMVLSLCTIELSCEISVYLRYQKPLHSGKNIAWQQLNKTVLVKFKTFVLISIT